MMKPFQNWVSSVRKELAPNREGMQIENGADASLEGIPIHCISWQTKTAQSV